MADPLSNLSSLDGSNGFTINGNTSDSSGTSVSNAGDINKDGISDLIIGAPGSGKSYVVFGSSNGFSTSLDLSSLSGSNGFTINGSTTNYSGGSVSNAGDINKDGIDDLIIGGSGALSGAGQSYVVFGNSNGFNANLDLSSLDGSNGFTINGINGRNSDGVSDSSGTSVSSAGDINGDGIDDLIIGAPSAASGAGQSYVVFGSTTAFNASINLSDLNGSNGFTINGNGTDSSGASVSSAGDVNKDGISDLIIGAAGTGKSYVVFGNAGGFGTSLNLSSLSGSNGFVINGNASDFFGASVSNAGDINGDGISDLIIGAPSAVSGAGQSYVVFGSSNGFSASLDLSNLDGSNGFAINGINGSDNSGYSVSAAGDVNDDGINDLIIGAPSALSSAGQSYVVFGRKNGFGGQLDLSNLPANQGFAISGNGGDFSGTSVSAAGDINGDGADDLLVGASGAASGAGQSYVIFGTPQAPQPQVIVNISSLDGSNGFTINGNTSDSSGTSVSNAGDINKDGISDLIIGAPGSGKSYVVFGSSNGFSTSLDLSSLSGSNGFTINGSTTNYSGGSVSNAGDINKDGIDDLIIGGSGALSGAGQSYVVFGNSNGFNANLDLSSLDGSNGFTINGINGRNSDGVSDSSGTSVSSAGDINGDGIDDLIIGAPSAASGAGQSYVVFGSTTAFNASINLSDLNGSNGFTINGNGTDSSGASVSSAGDVNKDGISDLIIGAAGTGKSYVVFGNAGGFGTSLNLSSLSGSNGFVINGNASDFFGASVSNAGDINGDGISDLIIGAPSAVSGAGQSYVVFGSSNGFSASLDLSSLDGSNGFAIKGINGPNSDDISDNSGTSVSAAGDVNDDGIGDLIIGAPSAGQSYVVFGRKNGFGGQLDLSNLPANQGFAISGNGGDFSGTSVSAAGDINGDGADDLLVGASGAASGAGQSYVIFGTPQAPQPQVIVNISSLDGSNGFTINGNTSDSSGTSVSNAGDINKDGISDLIIGAPGSGKSYVVFGSSNGFSTSLDLSSLSGSNGFTINGSTTNYSGGSVSNAGDINKDGIDDLIIGGSGALSGAGQSYVVFGNSNGFNANLDLSSLDGSNGFTINGINGRNSDGVSDSSGTSVSSAGDINGDGIDDLIIGAPSAASGAGQSYVVFGSTTAFNASINLSDLNGSNGFTINGNGTDSSGASVSSAGDVNKDGISDLIIGAAGTGKSYVVFGNAGGFGTSLNLSSLSGSNGFVINGNASDFFGASVSNAGDINGDGISDLIIGAPSAVSGAGQSYVVFGSSNGFSASLDLSSLDGSNGFAIKGINGPNSDDISDNSGTSVSAAGDVNDDGIGDLIIGAPSAGQSYVVFGRKNGFGGQLDLSNLPANQGFAISGNGGDFSGTSVSAAGDINGDGADDLLVGASGAASGAGQSYVIFGTPQAPQPQVIVNISSLDGSNGFTINGNTSDSSGTSVSNAGDINKDGISDLIIGAPGSGKSYVVFGSSNGFSTSLDLSSLSGSNGFTINGSTTNYSGGSVSNAGDINKDGIDDLIIGGSGALSGAGQSYVVFGNSNGFNANLDLSSLDGSNGFTINGINGRNSDGVSDSSGTSVSSAGDINGDGIDDLIIGAPSAASGAGQSYVVFGSTTAFNASINLSDLNGSNGFTINGNGTDSSGASVSSAGDVNKDGISDLIIGAAGTGKSYVVFGNAGGFGTSLNLSSLSGSNGFVINGNASDFFGASVSNAGDINGDGISDLIIGAPSAVSGAGQSYVVFGSSNGFSASLDLSSLDGSNGFAIKGINGPNSDDISDNSGTSVSAAGDVNDDGIGDLIIGAPSAGQSYVVFGRKNGFGGQLDLSNLPANQGFAISGNGGDFSGTSVSAAGDINGDGADDLLVGASGAASGAGQSYVIFGTPQAPQPQVIVNISSLDGSNGFTINGNTSDSSGTSVSNAGDINKDGISDLIIGAPGSGKSYVVFGSSNGFSTSLDLSSLSGSNGFTINGSTTNYSGGSVSNAGDINKDGIDDLIIGGSGALSGAGQSYVVFGNSNGFNANLDLSSLDGSNGFTINGINGRNSDGVSDSSGTSVSSAGDINGDGIDDLIIGAPSAASGAGQSYVVFGSTTAFNASINLSDLNGSNGFTINGNGTDSSGASVSSAGDVNKDGISDLIIGAAGTGKSYVVFGNAGGFGTSLNLSSLSGSNGFVINGNASDFFGASVSNAGDINGDGISDLIIGAPSAVSGAGQSYVVFGSSNGFSASLDLSSLDGSNGFAIKGINGPNSDDISDNSGTSVSAAGDVNDDGIGDLIIGAPSAGQSYVVFGRKNGFGGQLDLSNLPANQGFAISGNGGDFSGTSVSAAGDINGDGADDLLVGASGAASGAGQSYVIFGTPQPLELTNNNDVFNIKGDNGTVALQVTIAGSNSTLVNELGVYDVDDATGKIDGIAPGQTGYAQKALARGEVILSTIANPPNGFSNSALNRLLDFSSDTNVRFYLVKNSTTENVLSNVTPITDVLFSDSSNQKITSLGDNAFSLGWKDASGNSSNDFQNLVVKIQPTNDSLPLGTSLQGKPQGELIDLRDVKQRVKADFAVNREAAFNDFVGFYKVTDENGGIDTNGDGKADILVGQAGYAQAAVSQRIAGINLSVNNQGTASSTGTFEPGSIFAPFIIINGTPDTNNPSVYFTFLGANADKVDHIRVLGNNTFGFEDLAGGGDKDFNDIIVRANLSVV